MIIRARPKYLAGIDCIIDGKQSHVPKNEYYFNSGRAGLKFFLQCLGRQQKKRISIAMQAFNCNVVADAALEAACDIYLVDIKLIDFSVSLDSIHKLRGKIDVLLLTHYQGIPNAEYKSIIEFCSMNGIVVIEDMAQTYNSMIDNTKVGTLGDINIYSYAFDKPFTSHSGGKIRINRDKEKYSKMLAKQYSVLRTESDKVALVDIKTLFFLFKYSGAEYYKPGIDNIPLIRLLINYRLPDTLVYNFLKLANTFVFKPIVKIILSITIGQKNNEIKVKRLHQAKINIINEQRKNYQFNQSIVNDCESLCKIYGINTISLENSEIHWNRYSVIDEKNVLKEHYSKNNVQVGNFNWSDTLDGLYGNKKNVNVVEDLSNSHFASKHVLNIPIWSPLGD